MKFFKNFLKNNKDGSTIIWAVGVILVLLVVLAGALSVSKAYSVKSINNTGERQAYLTARSAVDAIIFELQNPLEPSKTSMNLNSQKFMNVLDTNQGVDLVVSTGVNDGAGNIIAGPTFDFDNGANDLMGTCTVTIKFVKSTDNAALPSNYPSALPTPSPEVDPMKFRGKITITAKVSYPGGEKTVIANLVGVKEAKVNGKMLASIQDHKDANGNGDKTEIFTRWIVDSYEEK